MRPVDVNGINKMAGEWYHVLYNNAFGITACALRLTNTYGPRMRVKDARQTFLGIWIRLLVEGKPFDVWDGEQLRDFTYVDDAVDALLLAAASEQANGQTLEPGRRLRHQPARIWRSCWSTSTAAANITTSFLPARSANASISETTTRTSAASAQAAGLGAARRPARRTGAHSRLLPRAPGRVTSDHADAFPNAIPKPTTWRTKRRSMQRSPGS